MTDDGAGQAAAHDGVQADVGLSDGLCAVRRFPARLFRLEHPSADHRANHSDGRCRDHRPGRAIPPGRHSPPRLRCGCEIAQTGLEPLSGDHPRGRGARRQCRVACHRHPRNPRLDGDRLSPARRPRWRRTRSSHPGVSIAVRLSSPGGTRSRRARTPARYRARRRTLVVGDRHRARRRRWLLRDAAGSQARGRDDGHDAKDHGWRSRRAPSDRGDGRRA